jgi:hypothetical protein
MVSTDFRYVIKTTIQIKEFSISFNKIEKTTIKHGIIEIKTIIIVIKRPKAVTKIPAAKVITGQEHKLANEPPVKIMPPQAVPVKITKANPFLTNKNPIHQSLQQLLLHLEIKHQHPHQSVHPNQ